LKLLFYAPRIKCLQLRNPAKNPDYKIEEYAHAELDLSSSLTGFSWKVSVPSLEEAEDGLMLNLPHRV